jgi:ABC-2 type transport system ATP-binding protein
MEEHAGGQMIIETENLTKRFRRHGAVQNVSLSVPEGATCALVGANGAGKTTLMRMLVNILAPDSGSARILGTDSRRLAIEDRLRVGYVTENQELPDRLSIAQYFEYVRALYPNWDVTLERQLREQFELPPTRPFGKLSHGMRMKAMLIGALAFRPRLLVLDEPLSGLDPLVRDEVISGLLTQAGETTILISSHELSELEGCTSHVAFMVRGKLIFQETIESLGARFRDVTATFSQTSAIQGFPTSWLNARVDGSVLHFIDSAFTDESKLRHQLQVFGELQHLENVSLSLRDISKEMMRATRQEA